MFEIMRVNGAPLTVRPIEITDVQRRARMLKRLSPESARFRFFAPLPRLRWPVLLRLADVDHCRRDALVALDGDEIVAVARYNALANSERPDAHDPELAVTVEDARQRRGLGRRRVRSPPRPDRVIVVNDRRPSRPRRERYAERDQWA